MLPSGADTAADTADFHVQRDLVAQSRLIQSGLPPAARARWTFWSKRRRMAREDFQVIELGAAGAMLRPAALRPESDVWR